MSKVDEIGGNDLGREFPARELLKRFVAWSEQRDAHNARGYVLHDEHQRVVLRLELERQAIVLAAKALVGS